MQWPPWTSSNPSNPSKSTSKWADNLNATDWSHYLEPRNIISTIILTSAVLGTRHIYKYYLRRIPGTASIGQRMYRKRSLFGKVTSVGDGDGFHLFHMPGGRLAGWGWVRGVPTKAGGRRGALTGRTVCVLVFPWLQMVSLDGGVWLVGGREVYVLKGGLGWGRGKMMWESLKGGYAN